jgi:hypothetical protein
MLSDILKAEVKKGVDIVKQNVAKYSATNKTVNSIEGTSDDNSLTILGRAFIEAMETGRGPRKSSDDGGFKDSMLEYVKARGMGLGLNEKQQENLARFLVLKINREGDQLYKMGGGRDVYSTPLAKFAENLEKVVADYMFKQASEKVFQSLTGIE